MLTLAPSSFLMERGGSRWLDIGQVYFYFFLYFFFIRDGVEVHKDPKKERDQYPAILTEQYWLIKDLLYGFGQFFLAGQST